MITTEPERVFHKFSDLLKELRLLIWEHALPGPRLVHIVQRKLKATFGDWAHATGATCRRDVFRAIGKEPPYNGRMLDAGDDGKEWEDANEFDDEGGSMPLTEAFLAQHPRGIRSVSTPPNILFVCREAFGVTMQHYSRSFACFGGFPETYFNFKRDTLYIRKETFVLADPSASLWGVLIELHGLFRLGDEEALRKIEHLAIVAGDFKRDFGHPLSTEEAISDLLTHFSGLKTLTIVLKHFENPGSSHLTRHTDDTSNISLREPLPLDEVTMLHLSITERLCKRSPICQRPGWTMPKVEYKLALSGLWLDVYEKRVMKRKQSFAIGPGESHESLIMIH